MAKKVKKTVGSALKGASSLLGGPSLGDVKDSANSAMEAALKQQRQAAENAQVDLSVENIPEIETGGTAEAQAEAGNKARRRRTESVSSSIGINVG